MAIDVAKLCYASACPYKKIKAIEEVKAVVKLPPLPKIEKPKVIDLYAMIGREN
jgi:hypothetical protein